MSGIPEVKIKISQRAKNLVHSTRLKDFTKALNEQLYSKYCYTRNINVDWDGTRFVVTGEIDEIDLDPYYFATPERKEKKNKKNKEG